MNDVQTCLEPPPSRTRPGWADSSSSAGSRTIAALQAALLAGAPTAADPCYAGLAVALLALKACAARRDCPAELVQLMALRLAARVAQWRMERLGPYAALGRMPNSAGPDLAGEYFAALTAQTVGESLSGTAALGLLVRS